MPNPALERMRQAARARASQHVEAPPSRRVVAALDQAFGATFGEGYGGDSDGFVVDSPELMRVVDLPRRTWTKRTDLQQLVDLLTQEYKTPQGTQELRVIQAILLETLFDVGGAVGFVGVGKGKTLATFLASRVVGAKRPMLLVPAKLRKKTERDFEELREHWQEGVRPEIVSYAKLGVVSGAQLLEESKPDLIIADEVQALSNSTASRSKRFVRYCQEHEPKLFLLSGTLTSRSLMDFHHFLALALGIEAMPLPAPRKEAKVWARAVDEKVVSRARPGALRLLLPPKEKPSLKNVRLAVGRRIRETPGVVATTTESVEVPIIIEPFHPKLPRAILHHFENLIQRKTTPIGEEAFPQDIYRHARTLANGFYYRWDPAPPRPWSIARSAWKSFANNILEMGDLAPPLFRAKAGVFEAFGKTEEEAFEALSVELDDPDYGLRDAKKEQLLEEMQCTAMYFDSELQVANGVRYGQLKDDGVLKAWQDIRKTFTPNSVPEWVTTSILQEALERDTGHSLIWVEHRATAAMLSKLSGLPYYGRLGMSEKGDFIGDHKKGSAILSIAANAEGRNLQHFSHNLVINPPASGKIWEQLLGRTHRPGQKADTITVEVMLGHPTITGQLVQARRDARFIQSTTGQPQKLLLADFTTDL